MANGSLQIGWRVAESVSPPSVAPVYGEIVGLGVNSDLVRVGHSEASYADMPLIARFARTGTLEPDRSAPPPQRSLQLGGEKTYDHLDGHRIACIGAGAGAVIMAAYFAHRGVPAENITLLNPGCRVGGIWANPRTQVAGFNNPKSLTFADGRHLSIGKRDGKRMLSFLEEIAHASGVLQQPAHITNLSRQRTSEKLWRLHTDDDRTIEAHSVVLATGRPHPRRIDGPRISSNLDAIPPEELEVERYQRHLTDEELSSGRHIVLIGLGNSTAAMLDQIHGFEDRTGQTIRYSVVTDFPADAVRNPCVPFKNHESIFRKPDAGYLTGYSGDLPRDGTGYFRALHNDHIKSDVRGVHYDRDRRELRITRLQGTASIAEPLVFALVGYDADMSLLQKMGALSRGFLHRETDRPSIRPCDGAIRTHRDGYLSNAYAAGAVVATPNNPNASVIPGIFAQAPGTMLTIAVRAYAAQYRGDIYHRVRYAA